jgi:hypothetical protein
MGMSLTSKRDDSSFSFSTIEWEKVLELGKEYGWIPLGTSAPLEKTWNGGYLSNDGQIVSNEDGEALANALIQAQIPELPVKSNILIVVVAHRPFTDDSFGHIGRIRANERWKWSNFELEVDVVSYYEAEDGWIQKLIGNPEKKAGHVLHLHNYRLPANEFYAGQQARIDSFIDFLKKGAFSIG